MSNAISVGWSLDEDGRGYRVEVNGEDGQPVRTYYAGNHPGVSDAWLQADDPRALSPATLRGLARQTACEIAVEHGLDESDVHEAH